MTGAGASQPSILEETEVRPRLSDGPWKVVLWDDDFHTYEYVIEMLIDVCQMPWEKAFQHAVEVDTKRNHRILRRIGTRGICPRTDLKLWSRSKNEFFERIYDCHSRAVIYIFLF